MAYGELQDRRIFNEMLFFHYRGISEDRMLVLAEENVKRIIKPAIYPGAKDLIRQCRDANLRVVLITGSLDITTKSFWRNISVQTTTLPMCLK